MNFSGHATIAIMDNLVRNDPLLRSRYTLKIESNKGVIIVQNGVGDDGRVYIGTPDPVFRMNPVDIPEMVSGLGLEEFDLDRSLPLRIVNAGLDTLLVPLTSPDACIRCSPVF